MNTITVCGNIAEPTLRYTTNDKPILTFSLASSRKVNDEVQTTWHNVKCFGTLAENLANVVAKGDRLLVSGRIEAEKWEDKDGNNRTTVFLIADEAGVSMRWLRTP